MQGPLTHLLKEFGLYKRLKKKKNELKVEKYKLNCGHFNARRIERLYSNAK